jgi:hypothetical protein
MTVVRELDASIATRGRLLTVVSDTKGRWSDEKLTGLVT